MEAPRAGGYARGATAVVESQPGSPRLTDLAAHPRPEPAPETAPEPAPEPGRTPSPAERGALLDAVVSMCETAPRARRPDAREALGEIFLRLVIDAEHDIRLRLAERIADADWAPPALIRTLALDDIDIARPVIAASPVLQDEDLLAVLTRATLEHQIAVAARPGLSPGVVGAVIDTGEAPVLSALAANSAVALHPDAMVRLVEAARKVAALRGPLARRPELSAELARGLYAWVGETLRQALTARFTLDRAALDAALADAAAAAHANLPDRLRPRAPSPLSEEEESEGRLVAKLEASGQLKPGYLLRVLRDGRLSLFEAGLAALGGFSRKQVRDALNAGEPARLAAACAAVGIDRSAFPTVLTLVRSLNSDRPAERPGSAAEVADALSRDRADAARAFAAMARRAEALG